ncbi:MAG: hypothetical protein AB7G28_12240 [Pirellulales bacterium]
MNRAQSFYQLQRCATALLALALLAGCRGPWSEGWKVSDMWSMDHSPWSSDDDSPQTPQRIVGSWTDTVLHTSGKEPQRGFGGRLIFYGEEAEKPILVEGQLVVYAFDETNRDPTDSKPTRRYVFPPDQVARRMSKTSLGPSYSFWLPWDDVGGPQTEISLIARFEPKRGALIMSEQTRHLLPGASTPAAIASHLAPKLPEGVPAVPAQPSFASLTERAQAAAAAAPNGVQLASYDAAAAQNPADVIGQQLAQEPARRMTTTSISLPENFRITNSGLPQSVRAGDVQLSGNVIAQPTAPPPSRSALAAPMAVPRPGTFPGAQVMQNVQPSQQMQQMQMTPSGFLTLRQSPLGNGFVAPVGGQQFSPQLQTPNTVGQINVPPAAPVMPGQPPLTTASGWTTTTYSGPAPQLGPRPDLPPPSSGYPPQTLPAQAAPAVR